MSTTDEPLISEGSKIYELGVQIVSSIPEEKMLEIWNSFKALIEKNKGQIISEETPKLNDLAYQMIKRIGGKNLRFTNAYFGWVKFEIETESINSIKEAADKNENVLRSIIIKTVRENTLQGHKFAQDGTRKEPRREITPKADTAILPSSVSEVEKAIDELIA